MNFFNIGPMELILLLVLALIILGPRKLPEAAKGLGKAISEFRKASQDLTSGIARELDATAEALKGSKESAKAPEDSKDVAEAADKDTSQGSTSKTAQSHD